MAQHAHAGTRPVQQEDATIGALVHDLSQEIPELVRSEIRLAQAEVAQKGRAVGTGLGMFSAAGLLAFFALGTLVAAAILGLAEALPAWASALVVAAVLLAVAGIAALAGRKKVTDGQPLKPERAVSGVQKDVAAVKEAAR
ncbi:MAG TPA: phage holin family protein [Marmoricola sp.]|nr:phage holin family protein [Marmoricola sp.]